MRPPAITLLLGCLLSGNAAEPLVIHEWGTFTSLQDTAGNTIGGLNVDEEHLPSFVHDLYPIAMGQTRDISTGLGFYSKGISASNPTVTMRLETPVVYVHLPPGQTSATFDLSVRFRGGFLSQFYPLADATVDGRELRWHDQEYRNTTDGKTTTWTSRELQVRSPGGPPVSWSRWLPPDLSANTISMLTWRGIIAGAEVAGPGTSSPVWLAPRRVDAADLRVGEEAERYLFYRGLGHFDAPLITRRSPDGATLTVSTRPGIQVSGWTPSFMPALWLAEIRDDGTAAFRHVKATDLHRGQFHIPLPATRDVAATFADGDFSADRLRLLKQDLHAALMQDGMFADEAHALLSTWEASYFQAPGQRLFFLVPRLWTDHMLPLDISVPATVKRSMVGRIELVSPAQQQALRTIAEGPVSTTAWFERFLNEHVGYVDEAKKYVERPGGQELMKRLLHDGERGVFARLRVPVPADYQAYLSLGRFRDALLWDAQRRTPDRELATFLRTYVASGPVLEPWQAKAMGLKTPLAKATDITPEDVFTPVD